MPLVIEFFGDNVHHAACSTVTVTGCRRAANHFDAFNHFRWNPAGIAAGIALATPAQTDGIAAGNRFAVNQDQGVFRSHAANVNLAIVAALAAGGVAGQVYAWHGTDDFGYVTRRRIFTNFVGSDFRNARRL